MIGYIVLAYWRMVFKMFDGKRGVSGKRCASSIIMMMTEMNHLQTDSLSQGNRNRLLSQSFDRAEVGNSIPPLRHLSTLHAARNRASISRDSSLNVEEKKSEGSAMCPSLISLYPQIMEMPGSCL